MSDTPPPIDQVQQPAVDIVQELIDSGDIVRLNEYIADNLHSLSPSTQQAVLELIANNGLSSAITTGLEGEDQEPGAVGQPITDEIPDDPAAAATWYERNYDSLSPDEQAAVDEHFADMATTAGPDGPAWAELAAAASQGGVAVPAEGAISQAAAEASAEQLNEAADAWADILANTPEGEPADIGRLNAYLPAGMTGADAEAFIAEAAERGQAQADDTFIQNAVSRGMSEDEARALAAERRAAQEGNVDSPLWLLRFVGGGRNLTDQVKQRYIDYWNDDHGGSGRVTSWEQLVPILESMGETTYTQNMTNAVLADQETLLTHSIEIPFVNGARRLNYQEDEMQALRDMGFGNDAIIRLVRLNALNAGRDAIEPGATGDTIPIFSTAALLRYYGGGDEFGTYNQISQDVNALEAQLGLRPEAFRNMSAKERREYLETLASRQLSPAAATSIMEIGTQIEALYHRQAGLEEYGSTTGVILAQNNYNRGLEAYNGDSYLAFISAVDPALAQRIAASGGDPTKMSGADNASALRILDRGGLTNRGSTMFERLGGSNDHVLRLLNYFDTTGGGGGGGGGAGPVRRDFDPVSVKEQLQKQFSDLMLDDIPDDVVSSVFNMLQGQLDKAPEGMSFDVSARILDWVQGRPEYAELYGKKPQGMNEAEYQTSFMAGVQDMLGAEANPEAVKAGMRENQYQTAVGRASAGQGLLTNSRLRGNWAAAKQTLDKFS